MFPAGPPPAPSSVERGRGSASGLGSLDAEACTTGILAGPEVGDAFPGGVEPSEARNAGVTEGSRGAGRPAPGGNVCGSRTGKEAGSVPPEPDLTSRDARAIGFVDLAENVD